MEEPPELYDSHVLFATKLFRDVGFTLAAMQYKRCRASLIRLKAFNGLPLDSIAPVGWHYHPNEWCKNNWRVHLPPCPHKFHKAGRYGPTTIVYRCEYCFDEREEDVS